MFHSKTIKKKTRLTVDRVSPYFFYTAGSIHLEEDYRSLAGTYNKMDCPVLDTAATDGEKNVV